MNKERWLTGALRKLSVALMRGNSWTFKAGLSAATRWDLSVESYGRMGAPAMALLRKVAGLAAESRRVHKQRWLTGVLRKLSVALMRGRQTADSRQTAAGKQLANTFVVATAYVWCDASSDRHASMSLCGSSDSCWARLTRHSGGSCQQRHGGLACGNTPTARDHLCSGNRVLVVRCVL